MVDFKQRSREKARLEGGKQCVQTINSGHTEICAQIVSEVTARWMPFSSVLSSDFISSWLLYKG